MRPKVPDKEKRKIVVRLLLSEEEKIRLSYFVRNGKFGCMSDFLRNKIFDQSRKKIITLDEKDFPLIKRMDYELNKIGVNLNQIAKKINSQNVSQFTYDDRVVFEQILQEHLNCFSVLQKYMEKVEPGK